MIKKSSFLLGAAVLVTFLNYVFHLVAIRVLLPQEFALLNTNLAYLFVLLGLAGGVQVWGLKNTPQFSLFHVKIKEVFLIICGFFFFPVFFWLFASMLGGYRLVLERAQLQSAQKYRRLGVHMVTESFIKLILLLLWPLLDSFLLNALVLVPLSMVLTPFRHKIRKKTEKIQKTEKKAFFTKKTIKTMLPFVFLVFFLHADLILYAFFGYVPSASYVAALRMAQIPFFLQSVLLSVPYSQPYSAKAFKKVALFSAFLYMSEFTLSFLIGKWGMAFLFGEEMATGASFLPFLVLGFSGLGFVQHKTWQTVAKNLQNNLISAFLCGFFLFNVVFGVIFLVFGSGKAFVASHMVLFLVFLVGSLKKGKKKLDPLFKNRYKTSRAEKF